MSKLREEYRKEQKLKTEIVGNAAISWVENNVVLINEKINRNAVNRLINSIQKFESAFGPYKSRIPAIASILDGAEENLQNVITGRAGDQRAADMLEYLSYVYNAFSTFFSKDLPILLKTKTFKVPRENKNVRLDSISDPDNQFKAEIVQKAFAHGIKPTKNELKLIGKILKSKNMPKLNAEQIAKELLSLSYTDLEGLTEVGKVPLVATPSDSNPEPKEDEIEKKA